MGVAKILLPLTAWLQSRMKNRKYPQQPESEHSGIDDATGPKHEARLTALWEGQSERFVGQNSKFLPLLHRSNILENSVAPNLFEGSLPYPRHICTLCESVLQKG